MRNKIAYSLREMVSIVNGINNALCHEATGSLKWDELYLQKENLLCSIRRKDMHGTYKHLYQKTGDEK